MVIARRIVETSLKQLGVLGAGRSPRASDANDAFDALQGLYQSWIASGAFGHLEDVTPIGDTYTPYCSCRIYRRDTVTVVLPDLIGNDWFCDYGWYRCCGSYNPSVTPRDGMVVAITDVASGESAIWLYDGTIKKWQQLYGLEIDDEAPRSESDPQGLSACLALEMSDQFGADPSPATVQAAARYKVAMTHRFGMRRQEVEGVYC